MVGRPYHRSGSGWEALPEVREWSVGNPGGPGVVGRPSRSSRRPIRRFRSGREAIPDVLEWSKGPPEGPGVVEMPTRRSGSGRETLTEVRE